MKDRKAFKYQHQLDRSEAPKIPRPRSRFDLICGALLIGLAVGIAFPSMAQWASADTHKSPAVRLAAMPMMPVAKKTSVTPAAPILPDRAAIAVQAKAKGEAVAPKAKDEAKSIEPLAAAKPLPSAVKLSAVQTAPKKLSLPVRTPAPLAPKLAKTATPKSMNGMLIEETAAMNAEEASAKTNATLLLNPSANASATEFTTIANARYDKDGLANCKAYCLVKSKDEKGNVINAVVSGPNFADILGEHQGTINLTGVKKRIKNSDVFMVQSITFNVSGSKSAPETVRKEPLSVSRLKTPSQPISEDGYEDLSVEPTSSAK